MPRILVTNDDGVNAEGIRCLASEMAKLGDVIVVAPDREKSAAGHALTLHRPLRLTERGENVYAVDGTPTDCVNLAVLWLMDNERPDLLVSGINHGLNLGDDVTYSGTVSAAFEGRLLDIPAVAFSQDMRSQPSFPRAARYARELIEKLLSTGLEDGLLLNVNLPSGPIAGTRWTRLGHREYKQVVVEKSDPRGRRYFWIAGEPEWQSDEGTDHEALVDSCVSVTPLHLDLTDYKQLASATTGANRAFSALAQLGEPVDSEPVADTSGTTTGSAGGQSKLGKATHEDLPAATAASVTER